jgi:hypothetical protein
MVTSILAALGRIKSDVAQLLQAEASELGLDKEVRLVYMCPRTAVFARLSLFDNLPFT